MDPELPVYEVHRDLCTDAERDALLKHGLKYDMTVMPSLMLGEEYVKTIGHDHSPCQKGWSHPEVFEVLEGEGRFLIQRYQGEELVDVSLVSAKAGDKVLVPPNCGHVMINASLSRLVVGNLVSRFCLQTYKQFIQRRGGAYYLLRGGKLVRNENYRSPPDVRLVERGSLASVREDSCLLASFLTSPEEFKFLNYLWSFGEVAETVETVGSNKDCYSSLQMQPPNAEMPYTAGGGLALPAPSLDEAKPFESSGKHWFLEPEVAVVVPTMNEAGSVQRVLREAWKYLGDPRKIVVIDASSDETLDIAARLGTTVLKQQGRGKGSALREAFDTVGSEIVVIMDGDGSMRAEEIPRFVGVASSGADIVKGSRFLPGGGSEDLSLIRRMGNSLFLLLVNSLWSTKYTDLCYGYLAFRKHALGKLKPYLKSSGFQIETEICIKAKKLGLRVLEVPSIELRRSHGKSKIHAIRDSFRILGTIFAEWISDFSPASRA